VLSGMPTFEEDLLAVAIVNSFHPLRMPAPVTFIAAGAR
jgi:hypothetical protein